MKTPREIMLDQHRQADRNLARIQAQVLATNLHTATQPVPTPVSDRIGGRVGFIHRILWQELIQPARYIWAGFTVVWVVIAAINLANLDHSPTSVMAKPGITGAGMTWQEQQKLVAELAGPVGIPVSEHPQPLPPKPRSDRPSVWSIG